jgi:hypothetical protein
MIVLKRTGEKPEAVWVTYGEGVGLGDGEAVDFELPVSKEQAVGLQILVNGVVIGEDRKKVLEEDPETGKVEKSEEDGWTVREREDGKVWVTFQKPPRLGARITCSVIGRGEDGKALAFKIYPTVRMFQDQFSKRHAEVTKGLKDIGARKKKFSDLNDDLLVKFFDDIFQTLLVDWRGVLDEDGKPLPCEADTKKLFLQVQDNAATFGFWISARSNDVRAYLMNRTEDDLKN